MSIAAGQSSRPLLARRQARLAAVAALQTIPAVTVQSPGDWNAPFSRLPAIKVRAVQEFKDAILRGMPEFTTTVTLEVEAAVSAASGDAAQDGIEALGYAIEQALFFNGPLVEISQKFGSVQTVVEVTAEGKQHLGGLKMSLAVEVFEAYDPTATPPADGVWPPAWASPVPLESIGIHADLANVFDPSGTYPAPTDPAYTPAAAPRTAGPDGRDEGALDITLPQ